MRQRKEYTEHKTFADTHQKDYPGSFQTESIVCKGAVNIQEHVHNPEGNCNLPPLNNEIIFHLNSNILCTPLTKIDNLRIEYGRQPVKSKHEKEVCSLELAKPLSLRMSRRIVIKRKHWFRAEAIRIFVLMIGVCMVSPMLSHPI